MKSKSFLFLLPYILNKLVSFRSGGHAENDEPSGFNRSQSESSIQSQHDIEQVTRKPKKLPLSSKKQQKSSLVQTKKPLKLDNTDYYDNSNNQPLNSNDQWDNWDEPTDNRHQQYSNDNRRHQQLHSHDLSTQKSNRYNKQTSIKTRNTDRPQTSTLKFLNFHFHISFFNQHHLY
jgi:hypothetical protein